MISSIIKFCGVNGDPFMDNNSGRLLINVSEVTDMNDCLTWYCCKVHVLCLRHNNGPPPNVKNWTKFSIFNWDVSLRQ